MTGTERFAVALSCIDGRIHDALVCWIRHRLAVDVVDLVTVQGPDRVLAHGDDAWVARLVERVRVSQRAHGSTHLVVASHSDCAGHPVSDAQHRDDVASAVARLRPLLPGMGVVAAHISPTDGGWAVTEIPVDTVGARSSGLPSEVAG